MLKNKKAIADSAFFLGLYSQCIHYPGRGDAVNQRRGFFWKCILLKRDHGSPMALEQEERIKIMGFGTCYWITVNWMHTIEGARKCDHDD